MRNPGIILLIIGWSLVSGCVEIKGPGDADSEAPSFAGLQKMQLLVRPYRVVLRWDAANDAITPGPQLKYRIYRVPADGEFALAENERVAEVTGTQFVDDKVEDGKGYRYIARVVDAAGNEDQNSVSMEDRTAPTFEGVETLTMVPEPYHASLAWKPASDDFLDPSLIGYRIYRAAVNEEFDFDPAKAFAVVRTPSWKDTTIKPGESFKYAVRAFDFGGNEDGNVAAKVAPADIFPPKFAGCGKATATGPSTVTLEWEASPDADVAQYVVYNAVDLEKPVGVSSETKIAVSGLSEQSTYSFVCRAKDAAGNLDQNTKAVSATTTAKDSSLDVFAEDGLPPEVSCFQSKQMYRFEGILSEELISSASETLLRLVVDTPNDANGKPALFRLYAIETATNPLLQFQGTGATTTIEIPVPPGSGNSLTLSTAMSEDKAWKCGKRIARLSIDRTPPFFNGCESVQPASHNTLIIKWKQAYVTSGGAPEPNANYFVYSASNLQTPIATTTGLSLQVTEKLPGIPLVPGTTASFVCRAADAAQNLDTNLKATTGTTFVEIVPGFLGVSQAGASPGVLGLSRVDLAWQTPTWPVSAPTGDDLAKVGFYVYWQTLNDVAGSVDEHKVELSYVAPKEEILLKDLTENRYTIQVPACHANATGCKRICFSMNAFDRRGVVEAVERNVVVRCASTLEYTPPTFAGLVDAKAPNTVQGFNAVELKWVGATGTFGVVTGPTTVVGYRAYKKLATDPLFDLNAFTNVDVTATKMQFTGLTRDVEYDFLVRAVYDDPNNPGDSPAAPSFAGSASAVLRARTKPNNPTFQGVATVTPSPVNSFSGLRVTYPQATGAYNRYNIYYKRESDPADYPAVPQLVHTVFNAASSTLTYDILGLDYDERYCVWVTAAFADTPATAADPNLLMSQNAKTGAKCARVTPVAPTFTGVAAIANSDVRDGNSASMKITFPLASGAFTYYEFRIDPTNNPPTAIAFRANNALQKTENGTPVDYPMVACDSGTAGVGCVVVQRLNYNTTYNVVIRAVLTGVDASNAPVVRPDDGADDTNQPFAYSTPAPPPFLVAHAGSAQGTGLTVAQVRRVDADDTDLVTTTELAASTNAPSQDFAFKFQPGITVPTGVATLEPRALAWANGNNAGSAGSGAKVGVYRYDNLGTGADGDLVVDGSRIIDQDNGVGRSYPDGVAYRIDQGSVGDGNQNLTVAGSAANGIAVGDEVVLYLKQAHSGHDSTNVGYFAFSRVTATDGNQQVTLTVVPGFTITGGMYLWMQRVPQYRNVTINGTLTARTYDRNTGAGGLVVFRATGDVKMSGTISTYGKGYHGGGYRTTCATGAVGDGVNLSYGYSFGSNGQGGGGGNAGCTGDTRPGAGGGHGSAGRNDYDSVAVPSISVGGLSAGDAALSKILYGGGGGGSNNDGNFGCSGMGAAGGGAVVAFARKFLGGTIDVRGDYWDDLKPAVGSRWGGGAGAGGTVWLGGAEVSGVTIQAYGGKGANACRHGWRPGAGGGGRVRIDAATIAGNAIQVERPVAADVNDSPNGTAGTLHTTTGGNSYITTMATHTQGAEADAALNGDPALVAPLAKYFNASNEVVVRVWGTYPAGATHNGVLTTDKVNLWYTLTP